MALEYIITEISVYSDFWESPLQLANLPLQGVQVNPPGGAKFEIDAEYPITTAMGDVDQPLKLHFEAAGTQDALVRMMATDGITVDALTQLNHDLGGDLFVSGQQQEIQIPIAGRRHAIRFIRGNLAFLVVFPTVDPNP